MPGLSRLSGSNAALTSAKAAVMRGPNIGAMNSEREMPSPCSPEYEPSNRRTSSTAPSAMARMLAISSADFILRIGRTCRHPTDAWAYQVPRVLWRANRSVIADV